MKLNKIIHLYILLFAVFSALLFISCEEQQSQVEMTEAQLLERGELLVTIGGCDDCHTPKKMGEHGPELIMERRFSGFQEGTQFPPVDLSLVGPWAYLSGDLTAAVGPWGMTYAANLTPDKETGIGTWQPEMFINSMKTGKHLGVADGRPVLPPMPWKNFAKLSEQDLKAMFIFLKSQKPIKNKVPDPITLDEYAAVYKQAPMQN